MGLFDFFKKSDGDKKTSPREIARLTRLVGSKLSQDYDRQEAIQILSQMANAEGARALLKRFDFVMDPSITDREEKEAAAAGVAAAGDASLQPLRNYCASAESLTWPLKILRQVVPDDRYVDELLELLEQFDTEYVRNSEPKIQLLNTLEDFPREDVRLGVEPFLTDVNEGVRFAAAGTVFAMNDAEAVAPLIEALESEESLRIKNRIASGIEQRGWEIPEALHEQCKKALPAGFALVQSKIQKR